MSFLHRTYSYNPGSPMAALHRTTTCLRFRGDDLEPDTISRALGSAPTRGLMKGGLRKTPNGREIINRTGVWILESPDETPGDLDKQVAVLFSALTDDLDVWKAIARRYHGDIFVGLFLSASNEGLDISPATLHAIGPRNLRLGLDIYSGDDEES